MLSKQGMLALALVLAVAGSTFAQPGPNTDAQKGRVTPKRPFAKGQAQFDLVPPVYFGTVPTQMSPAGCYNYAATDAMRTEGIPIKYQWPGTGVVTGWNDNVWVEIMCYPNANGALINVASMDDQLASSTYDHVSNKVEHAICYEGCEAKK